MSQHDRKPIVLCASLEKMREKCPTEMKMVQNAGGDEAFAKCFPNFALQADESLDCKVAWSDSRKEDRETSGEWTSECAPALAACAYAAGYVGEWTESEQWYNDNEFADKESCAAQYVVD